MKQHQNQQNHCPGLWRGESLTAKVSIRGQLNLDFFPRSKPAYKHYAKGTEETIEGTPRSKSKQYLYEEKR